MEHPRRQEVIKAICQAMTDGRSDWSYPTDCFCGSLNFNPEWNYSFDQKYLDALCQVITEFTRNYDNQSIPVTP